MGTIKRPRVVVVSRRTKRKGKNIDYVGELHLELLLRQELLPVIVPVAEGTEACLREYMSGMKGLLLVEGEDIEPEHFAAQPENHLHLEATHPLKDKLELGLLRQALRLQLPILGICRGSQLLNVVCGGTLFGDVRKEKGTPLHHIDHTNYDGHRHPVSIVKGCPMERWYGQHQLQVNSYHHQGVRYLAPRFEPMAVAEDGLVEAFYDPQAKFIAGLQFHPERMAEETAGNWLLWSAFGAAIRGTT